MRGRYKVLKLSEWMRPEACFGETWEEFFLSVSREQYVEIAPIFNRDGVYYDRQERLNWFEVKGRAFKSHHTYEPYTLKYLHHRPLSGKEAVAIRTLINYNRCPKELETLYYFDKEWRNLRDIRRGASNYTYKILDSKR